MLLKLLFRFKERRRIFFVIRSWIRKYNKRFCFLFYYTSDLQKERELNCFRGKAWIHVCQYLSSYWVEYKRFFIFFELWMGKLIFWYFCNISTRDRDRNTRKMICKLNTNIEFTKKLLLLRIVNHCCVTMYDAFKIHGKLF